MCLNYHPLIQVRYIQIQKQCILNIYFIPFILPYENNFVNDWFSSWNWIPCLIAFLEPMFLSTLHKPSLVYTHTVYSHVTAVLTRTRYAFHQEQSHSISKHAFVSWRTDPLFFFHPSPVFIIFGSPFDKIDEKAGKLVIRPLEVTLLTNTKYTNRDHKAWTDPFFFCQNHNKKCCSLPLSLSGSLHTNVTSLYFMSMSQL